MRHHPNILLILAEKIRYDCIGSSQMRFSKTPYIDWLASNGVWFEKAYTPHPNYALAQETLLSGRRVHEQVRIAYPQPEQEENKKAQDSWSCWIKNQNWLCSWFGEWQLSDSTPEEYGYSHHCAADKNDPSSIADEAARWLQDNGQQGLPWHICLNFPDNMSYSEDFVQSTVPLAPWSNFSDDLANKPMAQRRLQARHAMSQNLWSDWSARASNAVAQATRLDEAVGKLVAQINQLGLLEDTLIVFTAASGSMCGSHRLSGNEYSCYDEVMHVPMLLHWPGVIPAGLRCGNLVSSLLDLPATLMALLDKPIENQAEGFDLSCFWQDNKKDDSFCQRDGIMSSQLGLSHGLYSQRMYRDRRFKYVWNPTDLDELYDLEKDPYELINRIDKEPAQANRLRKLLVRRMQECNDPLTQTLQQEMEDIAE